VLVGSSALLVVLVGDDSQAANRPREFAAPRRAAPSGARLVEAEREVVEVGVEHAAVDAQREAGVGVPEHRWTALGLAPAAIMRAAAE
jgi:hypothetical protein